MGVVLYRDSIVKDGLLTRLFRSDLRRWCVQKLVQEVVHNPGKINFKTSEKAKIFRNRELQRRAAPEKEWRRPERKLKTVCPHTRCARFIYGCLSTRTYQKMLFGREVDWI